MADARDRALERAIALIAVDPLTVDCENPKCGARASSSCKGRRKDQTPFHSQRHDKARAELAIHLRVLFGP